MMYFIYSITHSGLYASLEAFVVFVGVILLVANISVSFGKCNAIDMYSYKAK